jgi:hypothetical protein
LRIKSRWFKPGDHHAVEEHASAAAFILWRVSHQMVKRLRGAKFDIAAGPGYFDVLRESLAFLCSVCDRVVHARLPEEERIRFVMALVRHCARHYGENAVDLLGPPPAGAASHADALIDSFNEASGVYAEFDAEPGHADEDVFRPGFAYLRAFARRLEPAFAAQDHFWLLDQVMTVEAPDALDVVLRAMKELFDPSPRPKRRAGMNGE